MVDHISWLDWLRPLLYNPEFYSSHLCERLGDERLPRWKISGWFHRGVSDFAEASRHLFGCAARGFSSGEFIALGQANTHFSMIWDWSASCERRSEYCPAIAQALGLLSSSAYPPARRIDCPQEMERESIIEFRGATMAKLIH